jgi:multiple sugar transport system substrate-binding protein
MAGRETPVGSGHRFADPDVGLEVLQTMRTLAGLVPPQCLSANPIEIAELLSSRDDWAFAPLSFGYSNYSRAGFRRHRLAHVDIPVAPDGTPRGSCLGGAGIAVSARSEQAEAAVAHAFWLAHPDVQRGVYYASGGQPGSATAWEDDAVNADSWDFFRNTRATLEASWVRPRYDGWLDVQDQVGTLVNRVLQGDLAPARCLTMAEDAYQRSLPGVSSMGGSA